MSRNFVKAIVEEVPVWTLGVCYDPFVRNESKVALEKFHNFPIITPLICGLFMVLQVELYTFQQNMVLIFVLLLSFLI